MSDRFIRSYQLDLGEGGAIATIIPPMRIAFNCDKSISGGLNKLNIKIYNLSKSHRERLVKDKEQVKLIPIVLRVGYIESTSLEIIFKGTVFSGSSEREGTDFITSLECLDGGYDYFNSFTSKTVRGKQTAVAQLAEDLPNTTIGKITAQVGLIRPKVLIGNTIQLIKELTAPDETFHIDNEQIFITNETEVITSYIPVVSAKTGLLNTPSKENKQITFSTLMNPALKLGGRCELVSTGAVYLNGIYKILSMTYSGDIDGSVWQQDVTCLTYS